MSRLKSGILGVLCGALIPMFVGASPVAILITIYIMIPLVLLCCQTEIKQNDITRFTKSGDNPRPPRD